MIDLEVMHKISQIVFKNLPNY